MANLSPFSSSPSSGFEMPLVSPQIQMPIGANNNQNNKLNNNNNNNKTNANPTKKSKPRKRVNTAEKRHQHNAIERQRRETLNGKFLVLARLLPALASHRRPSKSAIVNGSIAHLTYQRDQRLLAAQLLRQMASENEALLKEVNEWRKMSNYAPKEASTTWKEGMEEVCNVEKEVFGTFNLVDGDDAEEDDNEFNFDQVLPAVPTVFTQNTGLITPRPSTDINISSAVQPLFSNVAVPETRCSTASSGNVNNGNSAVTGNTANNWSQDFAWTMTNPLQPTNQVFSLGNFMPDSSIETSNTDSPATSQHGGVVTPPFIIDQMPNHTPSPNSSNGFTALLEEVKPAVASQQPMWSTAQILFAQQQLQLQRQQAQQVQQAPPVVPVQAVQQAPFSFASLFPTQATDNTTDPNMFTQQLMSSMFTSNNVSPVPGQIEQWRKNALGAVPQPRPIPHQTSSVHSLRHTVAAGIDANTTSTW